MNKVNIMSFLGLFIQLENKIEKLSLLKKIEFFLIPILLSILLLTLQNSKNSFDFYIKSQNRVFNNNQIKIIKDFTKYFTLNNITLQEIKQIDEVIKLSFLAEFSQFIKTIYYLETYNNFSYIEQITFLKNDKGFLINLTVAFKEFYLKNKTFKLKEFSKKPKKIAFKIEAIVMNYVLIDNNWCTTGDDINSYKIIKISNDFIELKKDNKIQKVFFHE